MNEALKVFNRLEHLKEGIRPIFGCVGTLDDFWKSRFSPEGKMPSFVIDDLQNVDWKKGTYKSGKSGALTAGPGTYIISAIDDANKFSELYRRCTGLLVAGIEKGTDRKISFLTHQDPVVFLHAKKDEYINHLQQRLKEMKNKCESGTVDAVIFGGKYYSHDEEEDSFAQQRYDESVKVIGEEIKKNFGFEPTISNGPKIYANDRLEKDDFFYDNENRNFFLVRPKVNSNTRDFPPSEINYEKNKWK